MTLIISYTDVPGPCLVIQVFQNGMAITWNE